MKAEDLGYKSLEELELHNEVLELFAECIDKNPLIARFFDRKSREMLEKKKEVLTKIKSGKKVSDKELYGILEKLPDGDVIWD